MATSSLGKLLLIALVIKSLIFADALKCYQCGQYNDGVGSITPCLNYTEQTAPFYLKNCPRSSDAYCIVSAPKYSRLCSFLSFAPSYNHSKVGYVTIFDNFNCSAQFEKGTLFCQFLIVLQSFTVLQFYSLSVL